MKKNLLSLLLALSFFLNRAVPRRERGAGLLLLLALLFPLMPAARALEDPSVRDRKGTAPAERQCVVLQQRVPQKESEDARQ